MLDKRKPIIMSHLGATCAALLTWQQFLIFAIGSSVNGKMRHAIAVSEAGPPGQSRCSWDSMPMPGFSYLVLV
jgi:hypothetical protein